MTPETSALSLKAAHQLLKQFDCLSSGAIAPPISQVQQALLQVAQQSDYQILGICADSIAQGQQALAAYTQALSYIAHLDTADLEEGAIAGAVYIKFNPVSGLCYADSYTGQHRGVLVACQSADPSGLNEMYGHLPLDLFSGDPVSEE